MRKQNNGEHRVLGRCNLPTGPQARLHAHVLIPDNLPISQIEVEVIAALLDDLEFGSEDQPK